MSRANKVFRIRKRNIRIRTYKFVFGSYLGGLVGTQDNFGSLPRQLATPVATRIRAFRSSFCVSWWPYFSLMESVFCFNLKRHTMYVCVIKSRLACRIGSNFFSFMYRFITRCWALRWSLHRIKCCCSGGMVYFILWCLTSIDSLMTSIIEPNGCISVPKKTLRQYWSHWNRDRRNFEVYQNCKLMMNNCMCAAQTLIRASQILSENIRSILELSSRSEDERNTAD